jgi:hypothetical protein
MPFDFSSDLHLDVGRHPDLKSDEKSKGIPIVLEISRCEMFALFHLQVHFIGASVHTSDGLQTSQKDLWSAREQPIQITASTS